MQNRLMGYPGNRLRDECVACLHKTGSFADTTIMDHYSTGHVFKAFRMTLRCPHNQKGLLRKAPFESTFKGG